MGSPPLLDAHTDATPPAVTRGAQARSDLIAAAAACFADSGLEGATTRQIAALARQNIAAINYYFVSKEGLYLAVVDHITEIIARRLTPLLDEIDEFLRREARTRPRALSLFKQLMGDSVRTNADIAGMTRIVAREQTHPTKAFDILYDGILERLQRLGAKLIAVYVGRDTVDDELKVRFHALLGQSLAFRLGRETFLRRTQWREIGAKEEEMICTIVEQQAELVLRGLARPQSRARLKE
jgi:AcrR family transcriptional regulator